jgi:hypothetical protein
MSMHVIFKKQDTNDSKFKEINQKMVDIVANK